MLLGVETLPAIGGILTAAAALLAGYAAVRAKKTDDRSADREETQQALDAQGKLLDRYEGRIGHLEERNSGLHQRVNDLAAKHLLLGTEHRDCQTRLVNAEARIVALEGA